MNIYFCIKNDSKYNNLKIKTNKNNTTVSEKYKNFRNDENK